MTAGGGFATKTRSRNGSSNRPCWPRASSRPGTAIGFKVQVGRELRRRALGTAYAGKANVLADLLSDLEKTTPLARALRGPADVLDAVDLAWYDRGKMVFLWQLDWTAAAAPEPERDRRADPGR